MEEVSNFLTLLAIVLGFFATLWALATKDRKRILKILEIILVALQKIARDEDENHKKGGENL